MAGRRWSAWTAKAGRLGVTLRLGRLSHFWLKVVSMSVMQMGRDITLTKMEVDFVSLPDYCS